MIKSYYQDEFQTIYLGDVLEVLSQLKGVDMIFADPPFNIGKPYGGNSDSDRKNEREYKDWTQRWVEGCWSSLVPTASFYLMTLSKHLDWKMPLMAKYGKFINLIIWHMSSAGLPKRAFHSLYQPIMLYGKTDKYIFNKYAQTFDSGQRGWHQGAEGEHRGGLGDSWEDITKVWAGSTHHPEAMLALDSNKKEHPCQMPEALALRAVLFSTNKGGIVLDPFCGSGTVARAAKRTGRRFIGIDCVERYCEMTVNTCLQDITDVGEEAPKPAAAEQETFL
jgi:site-specific DNA-methyltransferase (adenine-specific)